MPYRLACSLILWVYCEVEIPDSVKYIGARAFHGTTWMTEKRKRSPMVTVRDMLLDGSCCVGNVIVPPEIRLVCGWAFANGLEIKSIQFLSERVRVEEYAFRNCIYLQQMILSDKTVVRFTGLTDREKDLPPLAKQAVLDSLNCFIVCKLQIVLLVVHLLYHIWNVTGNFYFRSKDLPRSHQKVLSIHCAAAGIVAAVAIPQYNTFRFPQPAGSGIILLIAIPFIVPVQPDGSPGAFNEAYHDQ